MSLLSDQPGVKAGRASPPSWYAIEVVIDEVKETAREAVEYALMEAGALGTETTTENLQARDFPSSRITAYFETKPEMNVLRAWLNDGLRIYELPHSLVRAIEMHEVAHRDWLAEWKRSWQPVEIGESFIVAPSWSDAQFAANKIVLRIDPGMAFGTGTHETTRMCLRLIEKYFRGASFLDVGTGTGILAIAAARLNPAARIEACDTDAEAIEIARENALSNGVADRINFRAGTIDETIASSDCVCANLTADVIVPLLPALTSATCGRLILSGILDTQIDTVLGALRKLGYESARCEVVRDGEWASVVV
ncbi:MAG: 50S ribosomal protein L11 methyltransferase [Pyrinomonadaceae bacterium]|nr:50S ribosomal protein L11 methyltransferase [Pyrinomonadaceae bacterium]